MPPLITDLLAYAARLRTRAEPVSASRRSPVMLVAFAGIVMVAAVSWWQMRDRAVERHPRAASLDDLWQLVKTPPPDVARTPRVLVVPWDNEAGDSATAALGRVAADWITEGLQRTGLADVVDAQTVRLGLKSRARPDSAGTPDIAGLAARTSATLVLTGRAFRRRDSLEVWMRIVEPVSGRVVRALPVISAQASDASSVLVTLRSRALGALAETLDGRTDELISSADRPPSYEAYREYIAGLDVYVPEPWNPAGLSHFLRAAQLDTGFVLPLVWAAFATGNSIVVPRASYDPRVESLLAVLSARRSRLSPFEAAELDYLEARHSDDLPARHAAAVRAARLAPLSAWTYLAGNTAYRLGRYREAIATLHRLEPGRGWVRQGSAFVPMPGQSHHALGEFEEELADAALFLRADSLGVGSALGLLVPPLIGLGRERELMTLLDTATFARSGSSTRSALLSIPLVIAEARAHGHDALAKRLTGRCLAWLRDAETTADSYSLGAISDARFDCLKEAGRFAEARAMIWKTCQKTEDWYNLECDPVVYGALSARMGDTAEVFRMQSVIAEEATHRHELRGQPLLLEAHLAAIRGDRDAAVDYLRRAIAFQGRSGDFHLNLDFASLRGYAPFERLLVPPQ